MRRITQEPPIGSVIQIRGFYVRTGHSQGESGWFEPLLLRTVRGWERSAFENNRDPRSWADLLDVSANEKYGSKVDRIEVYLIAVAEPAPSAAPAVRPGAGSKTPARAVTKRPAHALSASGVDEVQASDLQLHDTIQTINGDRIIVDLEHKTQDWMGTPVPPTVVLRVGRTKHTDEGRILNLKPTDIVRRVRARA